MTETVPGGWSTRAMLEEKLEAAENVARMTYYMGQRAEFHRLREFSGVVGEFAAMCRATLAQNQDFAECSEGSGIPLVAKDHHLFYLYEKLSCIYGEGIVERMAELIAKEGRRPT